MSYAAVSSTRPAPVRFPPRGMRGFGSLLDMNVFTKAYYVALVQEFDRKLGLRKYYWSPVKYLDNMGAMALAQSYSRNTSTAYTNATLYEWVTDSFGRGAYRKTNLAVI